MEHIGEENIIGKTGLHPHPMYTLSKLMWYREERPDIYERLHTFLPFGSFILYKLGAGPVIDYSLASRTMAFDVHRLEWDENIIRASGLRSGIFPQALELGSRIGRISPAAAEALGLPVHLQLVLGGHDQVCATIGAGITEEGSAVDGIGTVECITPVFHKMRVNDKALAASKLALVPYIQGSYTTYAFNFTGGSCSSGTGTSSVMKRNVRQMSPAGVSMRLWARAPEKVLRTSWYFRILPAQALHT